MSREKDKLNERQLLHLFIALNVGLAAAFAVFMLLSRNDSPQVIPTGFPAGVPAKRHLATNFLPARAIEPSSVGAKPHRSPASPAPPLADQAAGDFADSLASAAPSPQRAPAIAPSLRTFTWREVESPEYQDYMARLRAVGCPEEKVRQIVLGDINELFDQKRIKEAVAHDPQWWRVQPDRYGLPVVLREKGRWLEEQRRSLIGHLLGPEALSDEQEGPGLWSHFQLTGPVLGALSFEKHRQVQAICALADDRRQSTVQGQAAQGPPVDNIELAHLRQLTRTDLRQVLSPQELEEFLLRYSHVAYDLRLELAALNPTEQEFRKAFRVIDPIDHQMQLEFGSVETMSLEQRKRYQRQRDAALKETLGPERYQAWLLTKDPLYRQAQMYATQFNAPPEAVTPIYLMTKATETRRRKIMSDASLTPEQKNQALSAMTLEQIQSIQKIASESAARR